MSEEERSEIARSLAELYQVKRVLSTSTVSYCRELLEAAVTRLDRLLEK